MLGNLDSDSWIDYILQGEKVTIYEDKLLFRDTGVDFMLKGDIPSRITAYDFKKEIHWMRSSLIIWWMKCILIYMQKEKVLGMKTS